ncbi:MAG: hypothetical protein P4L71_12665 [Acetobacteraceae bacterium]|nr:hypothetical protein [Acetobacteraceae bacterium]
MEAGLTLRLAAALALAFAPVPAWAGCDLDQVLGYQLVWIKTIYGYRDSDGKTHNGFDGCEPDRRIMFTDQTTLRCEGSAGKHLTTTKAYVFARNNYDMKMCVQDDLFDVSPLR